MTGEQAWEKYCEAVNRYLSQFPPRERHKHSRESLGMAKEFIQENFGDQVWEEFRDARFRAGYHR